MDSKASERSALQEIIDNALLDMRREAGGELDLEHVNRTLLRTISEWPAERLAL